MPSSSTAACRGCPAAARNAPWPREDERPDFTLAQAAELHTMSGVRRLLALFSVALALPALVHAASNPVAAAAKRTASAKSVTFQMSVTTKVAGQRAVMTGSGAQKGTEAKLTMRMRSQGVVFRFDAIMLQERGSYVMYMRSPLFDAQLPAGKKWVRFDLSKQVANLGIDFTSLVSASQSYAPLEKGLVSITRMGSEVVAGVPTTRYRAVVDIKRAAQALPEYRKQIEAIEQTTGIRLGRETFDVWIGGDGRFRRVRYSMPTAAGQARGTAVSTITFNSFNQPVSIGAPPRAQVFSP
jgi:hypothetical protein